MKKTCNISEQKKRVAHNIDELVVKLQNAKSILFPENDVFKFQTTLTDFDRSAACLMELEDCQIVLENIKQFADTLCDILSLKL